MIIKFFKKLNKFMGFNIPSLELSPNQEKELIEKIANHVTKYNMELPALMVGWWFEPISNIFANTTLLPFTPILDFLGLKGYELQAFLSKRDNVSQLVKRINELEREKLANKL